MVRCVALFFSGAKIISNADDGSWCGKIRLLKQHTGEDEKIMATKTKPIPDGYRSVTPYPVIIRQEAAP
jgi:hypothetical protein